MNFKQWLEAFGPEVIMVRPEWLYDKQPPRIKKIMDVQKKEAQYLASIKQSLQEKGFEHPLMVRKDWSIYDGLHRLRAALDMELEQIPVLFLSV